MAIWRAWKAKTIALLHLDAPYGREPIPLLEDYAEEFGFTLLPIPVGVTEMQNHSAQWLQIRRESPDFVFMWGLGRDECRRPITEAVRHALSHGPVLRHLVVRP